MFQYRRAMISARHFVVAVTTGVVSAAFTTTFMERMPQKSRRQISVLSRVDLAQTLAYLPNKTGVTISRRWSEMSHLCRQGPPLDESVSREKQPILLPIGEVTLHSISTKTLRKMTEYFASVRTGIPILFGPFLITQEPVKSAGLPSENRHHSTV